MNARPTAHPSVEVLRAFVLSQGSFVPPEVIVSGRACPDDGAQAKPRHQEILRFFARSFF